MHTMFVHQGAHLPHRMQRREHHPRHPLPDDALAPTRMSTLWASIVQDECHGWHGHTGGRAGGCVATQTHARDLAPGTPMVQHNNRELHGVCHRHIGACATPTDTHRRVCARSHGTVHARVLHARPLAHTWPSVDVCDRESVTAA